MNVNRQQHYGLLESDLHQIIDAVAIQPEVEQLILFGSRAKGTYKSGSDVDLAIKGTVVTKIPYAIRLICWMNKNHSPIIST